MTRSSLTAIRSMHGRIYFPGNPWPEGHALKELTWSARIDPERGLVFGLYLTSADYYAERELDDVDDHASAWWEAPGAWSNYHACRLSSNAWVVGTDREPLSFAGLSERTFVVDDPSSPDFDVDDLDDGRTFHIYLLGHDDCADHRIRFSHDGDSGLWRLDWHGRIALAYVGDYEFLHEFRVEAAELAFAGFELPAGLAEAEARALLTRWCPDVGELTLDATGPCRHLVPGRVSDP